MSEEQAVDAARLTDRDLQALIDCYADNRVLFRDQVVECLKELQTARAYLAPSGVPGSVALKAHVSFGDDGALGLEWEPTAHLYLAVEVKPDGQFVWIVRQNSKFVCGDEHKIDFKSAASVPPPSIGKTIVDAHAYLEEHNAGTAPNGRTLAYARAIVTLVARSQTSAASVPPDDVPLREVLEDVDGYLEADDAEERPDPGNIRRHLRKRIRAALKAHPLSNPTRR